ncbi:hypothetical protein ABID56_002338 [Alkalibacillus flavidus]|uniref:Integrase catalytic domain-containing protein n=1 Tax=Alkalibacillus flavidus TaxID=546021 RepID=A0ABV2KYK8_9BACI
MTLSKTQETYIHNLANNPEIDNLYHMDIEEIAIAADTSIKAVIRCLGLQKDFLQRRDKDPEYEKILSANLIKASITKPRVRKRYKVTPVLTELIEHYIQENKEKVKKRQSKLKKNKLQIHNEVIKHGFDIHYSTTCRLINELEEKKLEAFIKCAYRPGEYCEFDWGSIPLYINGHPRILKAGVFASAYSNYRYACLYESENRKSFVDIHNAFFNHCEGVYQTVVYDNMSLAVNHQRSKNGKKKPSRILKALSKHHNFNYRFCNVRKGNEKGHVEKTIGVIEDTIFSNRSSFSSLEEANHYLMEELMKLNHKECLYNRKTCIQRFKEEQKVLRPLQSDFMYVEKDKRVVNKSSMIQFQNNLYSVPTQYVGKKVDIHYTDIHIKCIYKGDVIATHTRLTGVDEHSLSLLHHTDLFIKKPGGFVHSLLYHQLPYVIQKTYRKYFDGETKEFMTFLQSYLKGSNEMVADSLKNVFSKIKGKITKEKLISKFEENLQ